MQLKMARDSTGGIISVSLTECSGFTSGLSNLHVVLNQGSM